MKGGGHRSNAKTREAKEQTRRAPRDAPVCLSGLSTAKVDSSRPFRDDPMFSERKKEIRVRARLLYVDSLFIQYFSRKTVPLWCRVRACTCPCHDTPKLRLWLESLLW